MSCRSPFGRVDFASLTSLPGCFKSSRISLFETALGFPWANTPEPLAISSGNTTTQIATQRLLTLCFICKSPWTDHEKDERGKSLYVLKTHLYAEARRGKRS